MKHNVQDLAEFIDEVYQRKAWHGTTLRGALRGVDAEVASWRPAPGRHNIWENVVHAAYWKYAVRRRLEGGTRGSFPLKGSNWFVRPDDSGRSWKNDIRLLQEEHEHLLSVVAALPSSALETKAPGTSGTNLRMIFGIAAHDVYHTGQIQLLKKLRG